MRISLAGRWIVAITGVMMAGVFAVSQGPGGMGGMGPGMGNRQPPMERAFRMGGAQGQWWNNPNMVTQLKLTDDQRKAMDGILFAHREKLVDLEASLKKADLEMQPLINADQPNEKAILAQIDKVAQARAELEKANAAYLLDLRSKLTADQWKQMQTMRSNRANQGLRGQQGRAWGRGMQGRGGPGQGMRGRGGQYRRQGPPPPAAAPGSAPPAQAPAPTGGTGEEQ